MFYSSVHDYPRSEESARLFAKFMFATTTGKVGLSQINETHFQLLTWPQNKAYLCISSEKEEKLVSGKIRLNKLYKLCMLFICGLASAYVWGAHYSFISQSYTAAEELRTTNKTIEIIMRMLLS